jgi:hypothetical protein
VPAVAYPTSLPTVLASKRASKTPGFSVSPVTSGALYVERTGTDNPTVFDVEWGLQQTDALALRDWVFTTLRGGALSCVIPLRTEDGLRSVTGNFMPDGLLDRQRTGLLWRYRATFVARNGLGVAL